MFLSASEFLELFVNRYPASLHLPRIYLADNLARAGRFDEADGATRDATCAWRKTRGLREPGQHSYPAARRISRVPVVDGCIHGAWCSVRYSEGCSGTRSISILFRLRPEDPTRAGAPCGGNCETLPTRRPTRDGMPSSPDGSGARMASMKRVRAEDFLSWRSRVDLLDGHFPIQLAVKVLAKRSCTCSGQCHERECKLCILMPKIRMLCFAARRALAVPAIARAADADIKACGGPRSGRRSGLATRA